MSGRNESRFFELRATGVIDVRVTCDLDDWVLAVCSPPFSCADGRYRWMRCSPRELRASLTGTRILPQSRSDMTNKTLNVDELDVLRTGIGETIDSFEGNPLGPGDYYGAVRINFANASVDISDFFESADVSFEAGMGLEEVGTMRVKRATGPLDLGDLVSGPENKSIVVDSTVLSVEVVNDTVEMMRDDEVTNTFAFTQAVIFHLEKGDLVVDRNVWFEVFLSACVTSDARKFIRDTEKDWNRGAGKYHAVVKREFVLLD